MLHSSHCGNSSIRFRFLGRIFSCSGLRDILPVSVRPDDFCLRAPQEYRFTHWGISSVGRALRSQCKGQGFDSPMLHNEETSLYPDTGKGGCWFSDTVVIAAAGPARALGFRASVCHHR